MQKKLNSKKFITLFILILLTSISTSFSQLNLYNWRTYSSILDFHTGDIDSKGRIWLGTTGGVAVFNQDSKTYEKLLTNIDGLLSIDISVIRTNQISKEIFIGSFDGYLEIMSEDMNLTHVTDIQVQNFPKPQINDILFKDSLAYLGGGFGLTVFDQNARVFLYTPPRLGSFAPNTIVNKMVFYHNELWVATEAGIAKVNLANLIINPDNWINYTQSNGLPSGNITTLCVFNDTLYAGTSSNIFKFSNDTFSSIYKNPDWDPISELNVFQNNLWYSSAFELKNVYNPNDFYFSNALSPDSGKINTFIVNNNSIISFIKNDGITNTQSGISKNYQPNVPLANVFYDLDIDNNGSLWASTGFGNSGVGFEEFNGIDTWKNYNTHFFPQINTNAYYLVNSKMNNKVVLSSWGNGFIVIDKTNGTNYSIYNTKNSPLTTTDKLDSTYAVTGGTAWDKNGILWIVNYGQNQLPGPLLLAMDTKGKFYSHFNSVASSDRYYQSLIIDDFGTKWLGSTNISGLYYYNENNTLTNTSDDISGVITQTSASSLPNNQINCLANDSQNGIIWLGTPSGVGIIYNPSAVLRNGNPTIRKLTILQNLIINDIMIDALGNKWFATNQGVWVYNTDASQLLAQLTKLTYPLVSDEILSIKNDTKSGKIYIGTNLGLSVVSTFAVEPLQSFSIKCYPQPFLPLKDGQMIIDGLAPDADVRILTIDGELVKALSTNGKILAWDGKNEKGVEASSGVYMVVATSGSSDQKTVAKFVVINN